MKTRQLGKNGPELTIIGLGTWAIGGPWAWGWGAQDDNQSVSTIRQALDAGINWIDTAAVYGLGHSEEVLARALGPDRERVFLATKCGLVWDDRRRVKNNNQPESIRSELEASLHRLKTDHVDLYQIHWPDPDTPVEDSWETMLRLQEEGKTRYIGVSNFDAEMLAKCESLGHVNSLQPPYSLLNREIEDQIQPWCRQQGTGVVAYSPMQSGLLSGKFDVSRLAPDDWRHKSPYFKEPQLSRNLKFVDELRPIAEKYGATVGQLAIAWVLHQPGVTSAIVGARHPKQVDEMLPAAEVALESTDLNVLDKLSRQLQAD